MSSIFGVCREGRASDLHRSRQLFSRALGEAEAGHGSSGNGRDGDVSGDGRAWYGGDAGLGEDRIVSGRPELDTRSVCRGSHGVEGGREDEDEADSVGREHDDGLEKSWRS